MNITETNLTCERAKQCTFNHSLQDIFAIQTVIIIVTVSKQMNHRHAMCKSRCSHRTKIAHAAILENQIQLQVLLEVAILIHELPLFCGDFWLNFSTFSTVFSHTHPSRGKPVWVSPTSTSTIWEADAPEVVGAINISWNVSRFVNTWQLGEGRSDIL